MDMLWHNDESVQFEALPATISVKRLQEKTNVSFHNEQSATLKCTERHEISCRRRDESSRFQSKPQRLEAASLAKTKSTRVELVPFPVIFITKVLVLGRGLAAPYILPKRGTALSTWTTRSLNSNRSIFR
jgi:hypothetical protein